PHGGVHAEWLARALLEVRGQPGPDDRVELALGEPRRHRTRWRAAFLDRPDGIGNRSFASSELLAGLVERPPGHEGPQGRGVGHAVAGHQGEGPVVSDTA